MKWSVMLLLLLVAGCASKYVNKETDVSADAFFCFMCLSVDTDFENNLEYDEADK